MCCSLFLVHQEIWAIHIKRQTLGFVEWSRRDGVPTPVPWEGATLASRPLLCGQDSSLYGLNGGRCKYLSL